MVGRASVVVGRVGTSLVGKSPSMTKEEKDRKRERKNKKDTSVFWPFSSRIVVPTKDCPAN